MLLGGAMKSAPPRKKHQSGTLCSRTVYHITAVVTCYIVLNNRTRNYILSDCSIKSKRKIVTSNNSCRSGIQSTNQSNTNLCGGCGIRPHKNAITNKKYPSPTQFPQHH